MQAGRLRYQVAIDHCVITRDADGDPVERWYVFANNIPADIVPLSARELMAAAATQSEVTANIKIRWLPGLKASMRVRRLDDGRYYNIAGAIEDNRTGRQWMTLPASTGLESYAPLGVADVLTTEGGDQLVTESGDHLVTES